MDALDQSPVFNNNLKLRTLDITPLKAKGEALHKEIKDICKDDQSLIQHRMYDELLMTKKQFEYLRNDFNEFIEGYYIYDSGFNVMEVRVK
jgi:hypothetical protein